MAHQQRILITGGTGFAGSHLVEYLLQHDYSDIHVTSLTPDAQYVGKLLPETHIHPVDLSQAAAVQQLIQQVAPDSIYHLAAIAETGTSFAQAETTLLNNTALQLNILEAVRQHAPTSRMLCVGSGQEYNFQDLQTGQKVSETHELGPANPYAVSKVTQDLLAFSYVQAYDLDIIRVRPFNHLGERQSPQFAIAAFARQIALVEKGEQSEIAVGNLSAVRDFTDVKDVVAAYVLLMEKGVKGEVYNIGSGKGTTMQQLLDQLVALATTPITVVEDPAKLRPIDIPAIVADITKMQQLGWQPKIPLNESLKRVLMYWRTQV